MSSFPGRRGQGVNMSQYIQNLNEIPKDSPPKEQATTLEDELAMFTNTNFTDWDAANHPGASPVGSSSHSRRKSGVAQPAGPMPTADAMGDIENFEFHLDGYGFDFTPYAPSAVPAFAESIGSLQPIQPTPAYNGPNQQQRPSYVNSQPSQPGGEKRKSDAHLQQQPRMNNNHFEDQSRVAAEEDKRRRNTAASARFRVKKKAREQALEKSQKELNDKVSSLESRIHSLETENKWLRELIMDKNGGNESAVNMMLDGRREKEQSKQAAS